MITHNAQAVWPCPEDSATTAFGCDEIPGFDGWIVGGEPARPMDHPPPAALALAPSASPQNIGAGPMNITVPVLPTTADTYPLDLRWPGMYIFDGQTGGFCGLRRSAGGTRSRQRTRCRTRGEERDSPRGAPNHGVRSEQKMTFVFDNQLA